MLHCHVSTVAKNGQANSKERVSGFLAVIVASPACWEREGEERGIQLVAIRNLTTRCH